jgi:CheY-like chemotaxis protein
MADMPLADAVTRAIEAAQPVIEARKHRLDVEQPPRAVHVRGDLVRLTQLFTNLISNAAKYTAPGGEIRIVIAADAAEAVVTVSDDGEGIAPERMTQIFEPFMQTGTVSRTGLGIGLPLARRIAELHGGSIEATSSGPGKGSAFSLRLPIVAGVHDDALSAASPSPSPSPSPSSAPSPSSVLSPEPDPERQPEPEPVPRPAGCRVLVVDDNADAADALQALLQWSGCEVRCAYDGESALLLADQFDPEVVLLDLALPDISGYEVLRRMRATNNVQPAVVALTGYAQPADVARMEQAGFDRILRKPVDVDTVVALVSSLRKAA